MGTPINLDPGQDLASPLGWVQLRSYLDRVVTIQCESIKRLIVSSKSVPPGLGEMLEDVGNRYLDLAEMVRDRNFTGS